MAKNIILNDGSYLFCGDVNMCSWASGTQRRTYWYKSQSDPINIKSIYDYMVNAGYSTDLPSLNDLYDYYTTGEITDEKKRALQEGLYWILGDVEGGGIAFGLQASGVRLVLCIPTEIDEQQTGTPSVMDFTDLPHTVGVGSGSNADCILYLIHETYLNGKLTTTQGYMKNYGAFNVEYLSWDFDENPLYDVVAEQYADMVDSNTTDSAWATPAYRKCPAIVGIPSGGLHDRVYWWFGHESYDDSQDDGGTSTTDGGEGEAQESEPIDFPDLPPSLLLDSGVVKMFNPSVQDMDDFINFIYSAPTAIIDNFKKIWANPMDSIISLSIFPHSVPTAGSQIIKFCGVSTGVTAPVVYPQFKTVDCGSRILKEEYKTLLDYSNYTKVKCFLPFFGFVDLNADDVVGSTIHIKYNIDMLTGECIAIIKCTKFKQINEKVKIDYDSCLYEYKGNLISQVPLTGNNYQQLYSGVLNLVSAVALPNPVSVAGVASDLLGQKVSVQRGGSITGNGGSLGEYKPYLIIERPIRHKPEGFEQKLGYPSDLGNYKLKDYKGYTEIDTTSMWFDNIPYITKEEIDELRNLLESGVII